jgi:hypothetical protein
MKKVMTLVAVVLLMASVQPTQAQCAMCTKTAQQLGEKPAKGLNKGILYLMFAPLAIMGIIGYRWWRSNKDANA